MDPSSFQYPVLTLNHDEGNDIGNHSSVQDDSDISVPAADDDLATLEWLSPLTPQDRHQAVRRGRVDGVGDWLLQTPEFVKWHKSEDDPANQVLFCHGAPGVGKTCLSSLVIDTLHNQSTGSGEKDTVVAYIYCDFNADSEESTTSVPGSLLKQVVSQLRQIPEEVQNALESAKNQVDGRGPQLPEILTMLTKSLSCIPRGFVCIDALDEFPAKHRPELWKSLKDVVCACPNTRLFLTGRPHIRDEVQKYFPGAVDMIPISPTKEDIGIYVRMRLAKDSVTDEMDERLQADILRIIPEKMSEIFLLVSLAMDAILAEATIYWRTQTLHRVADGLGLEYAYGMTLARIRDQGRDRSKLGMDALMWVCRSERPLSADELCHALGVGVKGKDFGIHNAPSIRTVLGSTLGLLTIDEITSTVRLLHFTLQEYLGGQPTLFATPHSRMAEVCLTYLNSKYIRELPPTLGIDTLAAHFLEYATCFWATHAAMDVTESVKFQALQLLNGYENHVSANILLRKIRPWYVAQGHVEGFTGLHCVAFLGITEIARSMLVAKTWDLNRCDSKDSTPLSWAVTYGNEEVVKLLLEQEDTNPNVPDGGGRTPLSLAADLGREYIVKLLLERGDVKTDLPDDKGRTPLSFAAELGREDIVKLLLERAEVNPSSSDNAGRTPLSLASEGRKEVIMELLKERLDSNPSPSGTKTQFPLPIPTMNSDGGTAKQISGPGNPNQKLSNKNHSRTPPSVRGKNTQKQETIPLLPEQGDVTLPTADNPDAAASCAISRSTLATSLEKQPAPPPRPKFSRSNQSDLSRSTLATPLKKQPAPLRKQPAPPLLPKISGPKQSDPPPSALDAFIGFVIIILAFWIFISIVHALFPW